MFAQLHACLLSLQYINETTYLIYLPCEQRSTTTAAAATTASTSSTTTTTTTTKLLQYSDYVCTAVMSNDVVKDLRG